MQPGLWQLLIVAALVLILFGRGRISEMMGDVGKGIRSFKKGITEEEQSRVPPPRIESETIVREDTPAVTKTAEKEQN